MRLHTAAITGLCVVVLSAAGAHAYTYEVEGTTVVPQTCASVGDIRDPADFQERTITARFRVLSDGIVPKTVDVTLDFQVDHYAGTWRGGGAESLIVWTLRAPDGSRELLQRYLYADCGSWPDCADEEEAGHFPVEAVLLVGAWYTLEAKVSLSAYELYDEPGQTYACAATSLGGIGLPDLPSVRLEVPDPVASEDGPSTGVFKVTRTGGDMTAPLKVKLLVTGTALNGVDYETVARTLTIPASSASAVVLIKPVDDVVPEETETVELHLRTSHEYSIGLPRKRTITIVDNDGPTP